MPISESCLRHGRTPRRWPLQVGSQGGFHHWLAGKYRRLSKRVRGFPALVFLRPYQSVAPRGRQNPVMYAMHLTLVTPTLHSQLVLGESSQGQIRPQVAKMPRATAFPALLPAARLLAQPATRPQPGQAVAAAGFTPSLPMTSRTFGQTPLQLYKAQRLAAFPALLPAARLLTQPATRTQPGQVETAARFTHQGQRPVELSYVLQAASLTARPEQRQETAGVFAPPVSLQSMSTPSQAPGLDVNRLTEQVYQALERKLRLEKQRRGYR
jgi:hypothetical protein